MSGVASHAATAFAALNDGRIQARLFSPRSPTNGNLAPGVGLKCLNNQHVRGDAMRKFLTALVAVLPSARRRSRRPVRPSRWAAWWRHGGWGWRGGWGWGPGPFVAGAVVGGALAAGAASPYYYGATVPATTRMVWTVLRLWLWLPARLERLLLGRAPATDRGAVACAKYDRLLARGRSQIDGY